MKIIYKTPIIKIEINIKVITIEVELPVINIAVGPSAPPMIPIELELFVFNLIILSNLFINRDKLYICISILLLFI